MAIENMSSPFNYLETPRLFLREITPEVYHSIFSSYTDAQLMDFFSFTKDEELAEEKDKYSKGLTTFNKSFLYFHLMDKTTGRKIGWCGYHTWYLPHRRAEIGYEIYVEALKNSGLMTEAIAPIIDYGFRVMDLNRIEAFIGPRNTASQKLVKNLGFVLEGNLRSHYLKNEVFQDSYVFSLLRSEYSM
jgi:ribosomal-protein-alanine N-acetyltransferase